MSAPEARRQLADLIKSDAKLSPGYVKAFDILVDDYRKQLDVSRIHILDLSKEALEVNLAEVPGATRQYLHESIDTLWKVVSRFSRNYGTLPEDIPKALSVLTETVPIFVTSEKLLICKNFKAARNFITSRVSKSKELYTNEFFGSINRARTKQEYLAEGYTLTRAKDPDTGKDLGGYYLKSPSGNKRSGIRYFNRAGEEIVEPGSQELKTSIRSRLDIGHNYAEDAPEATSVIALKLNNILKELPEGSPVRESINDQLNKLTQLTASITFSFKNTVPESDFVNGRLRSGYLVLGLEFYTLNNKKAKVEGAAYQAAKDAIFREIYAQVRKTDALFKISGSNTPEQDLAELVGDKYLAILSGKRVLRTSKKHATVNGSTSTRSKKSKTLSSNAFDNTVVIKRVIRQKYANIRNLQGQFYSLANLQKLLDANLVQKIKDNMGDGTRRDVLNLRSGRFAESAKVERLSQSREGMITAFYTYMKNPYQTFELGFKQGGPNSRNPKLLISKSIREIAATQVANRMRAVLV